MSELTPEQTIQRLRDVLDLTADCCLRLTASGKDFMVLPMSIETHRVLLNIAGGGDIETGHKTVADDEWRVPPLEDWQLPDGPWPARGK